MNKSKPPEEFRKYFWDVDFEKLNLEHSKVFILKRLLDRGDTKAVIWLRQHYTADDIKNLLLTTRDLSAKTANFWANYLKLDHKKVPCLQKPYSRIPFGLSS
ncbi:MAG: hypothetical protein HYU80_01180 [Candidatus Blackburnbacteria bacterium]|nr:hypothetical protein [Candidatus Blackburnbacteria bacterium]